MDRISLNPGDSPEHVASAAPPSPLPSAPGPMRHDTMPDLAAVAQWPWAAPAETDFSPTATAWRAAKAFSRTERQKEVNAELTASLSKLKETIDAGREFLATLAKILVWAARILGGAGILASGVAFAHWLFTFHH